MTAATLVSIAVTPVNPSVATGGTQQFTATGTYSDGTTQNLTTTATWASSSTTTATMSATGLARALKAGTSTIQATSGSVTRIDDADGDGGDAGIDRGDAGEPVGSERAGRNSSRRQERIATEQTQNLTTTATWASRARRRRR